MHWSALPFIHENRCILETMSMRRFQDGKSKQMCIHNLLIDASKCKSVIVSGHGEGEA